MSCQYKSEETRHVMGYPRDMPINFLFRIHIYIRLMYKMIDEDLGFSLGLMLASQCRTRRTPAFCSAVNVKTD